MDNYASLGVEVDVSKIDAAERKLMHLLDVLEKMIDANSDLKRAVGDFRTSINQAGDAADKTSNKLQGTAKGSGLLGVAFDELAGRAGPLGEIAGVLSRTGAAATAGLAGVSGLAGGLGAVAGTGAGLIAVAGTLAIIGAFSAESVIGEMSDLGDQTGRSANEMLFLTRTLQDAGLSLNDYEGALRKVQTAMSKTGDRTSEETKAFKTWGVVVTDSTQIETTAIEVAAKYRAERDAGTLTSEKAAAAQKLFGENADKATAAITNAAKAEELRQQMFEAGVGISTQGRQASDEYGDAMLKMGIVFTDMGDILVQNIIPPFTTLIDSFVESYTEGGFVKELFDEIVIAGRILTGVISMTALGFETLVVFIQNTTTALLAYGTAAARILSGDLGGAKQAISDGDEQIRERIDKFAKKAERVRDETFYGSKPRTIETPPDKPKEKAGKRPDAKAGQRAKEAAEAKDAIDKATASFEEYISGLSSTVFLQEQLFDKLQKTMTLEGAWSQESAAQILDNYSWMVKKLEITKQLTKEAEKLVDAENKGKKVSPEKRAEQIKAKVDKNLPRALDAGKLKMQTDTDVEVAKKISNELEKQKTILFELMIRSGERSKLEQQLNKEIESASGAKKEELKIARDTVLIHYDSNKKLSDQRQLIEDILMMERSRITAIEDLGKAMGLLPSGKGDYRTSKEKQNADQVRQVTDPYKAKIDAAQMANDKIAIGWGGPSGGTTEEKLAWEKNIEDIATWTAEMEKGRASVIAMQAEAAKLDNQINIANGDFTAWAHGGLQGVIGILDRMPTQASAAASMVSTVGQALEDGIVNMFETGKFSVEDFFKTLLKQLARLLTQLLIIKPLMDAIRGYATGGSGTNAAASVTSESQYSLVGSGARLGTAYDGAVIQRLSSGGIVGTLSSFQTTQGRTTVAEKNAEAVMPLQRNSRGQLGVVVSGSNAGGGSVSFAPNITVQVGSVSDASDPGKIAQAVASQVESQWYALAAKEKRPGGLLAK